MSLATILEIRLTIREEQAAIPPQIVDNHELSMNRLKILYNSQGFSNFLLKDGFSMGIICCMDVSMNCSIALKANFSTKIHFIHWMTLVESFVYFSHVLTSYESYDNICIHLEPFRLRDLRQVFVSYHFHYLKYHNSI